MMSARVLMSFVGIWWVCWCVEYGVPQEFIVCTCGEAISNNSGSRECYSGLLVR